MLNINDLKREIDTFLGFKVDGINEDEKSIVVLYQNAFKNGEISKKDFSNFINETQSLKEELIKIAQSSNSFLSKKSDYEIFDEINEKLTDFDRDKLHFLDSLTMQNEEELLMNLNLSKINPNASIILLQSKLVLLKESDTDKVEIQSFINNELEKIKEIAERDIYNLSDNFWNYFEMLKYENSENFETKQDKQESNVKSFSRKR